MKKIFVLFFLLCLLCSLSDCKGKRGSSSSTETETGSIVVIPGSEGSPFGNYLNNQTPLITEVSHSPETPGPMQDVTVTAEISNDPQKTDDITEKAMLFYSIDTGQTWLKLSMSQDASSKALWTGKIPGQASGTSVTYYVQGMDSAGNIATELPMNAKPWLPDPANNIFPPSVGINGPEWVINATTVETNQAPSEADTGEGSFVDGKTLFYKVKRSFISENPTGTIKVLGMTTAITCTDLKLINTCLVPGDASKYIYAYFRSHSYTVK